VRLASRAIEISAIPSVDICVIRVHQPTKLPQDLPLVITIVGGQAGEEVIVDLAVNIVDVHLFHPLPDVVLDPCVGPSRNGSISVSAD